MPTKIEWCDETWSPITGCSPISDGCKNCYARRMANRLRGRFGYPQDDPFRPTFHEERLGQPYRWKKSRRIFVCSMGDLFHEDVAFSSPTTVWGVMQDNPHHTFMVLTKRPQRMFEFLIWWSRFEPGSQIAILPNVWLGVTIENEAVKEERLRWLMRCPAPVRFVSVEPMLGPVDLSSSFRPVNFPELGTLRWNQSPDWVICGAETGPGKRPMDINWARDLRDQCRAADVPFFFKKDSCGSHYIHGRAWDQFPKAK